MNDNIVTINVGNRLIHFRMWHRHNQPYNLCEKAMTSDNLWAPTRSMITCPECLEILRK